MSGTSGLSESDAQLLSEAADGQPAGSYTLQRIRNVIVSKSAQISSAISTAFPAFQQYRDPTLQPFSSNSIWNKGIGSGATWETTSNDATAHLVTLAGTINSSGNQYDMPHYIGTASDPLVVLHCNDTTDWLMQDQAIHVPIGSAPAAGGDKHMNFFDRTQPGKMWSAFDCSVNNADGNGAVTASTTQITAFYAGIWDVRGDGLIPYGRTTYPTYNDTTQTAGNANYGIGTIRDWELTAGAINHMLRFTMGGMDTAPNGTWYGNPSSTYSLGGGQGGPWCDFYGCPQTLAKTTTSASSTSSTTIHVTSATGITTGMQVIALQISGSSNITVTVVSGTTITLSAAVTIGTGKIVIFLGAPQSGGSNSYKGIIPFGVTIGIPASTNLSTLGLSADGLILATCLQKYGAVQRDTLGPSSSGITLYAEPQSQTNGNATRFTNITNDFNSKIVPQLRVMTNQASATTVTGQGIINGGGTYPTPLPPVQPA